MNKNKISRYFQSKRIFPNHRMMRMYHAAKGRYAGGYAAKGIKYCLSLADLIHIWSRDGANSMAKPSLHRIDSQKNYDRDNCQIIEWSEHRKIHAA